MKDRYALVTGGSSGIGRAACIKLAELKLNIIINYNTNHEGALETKKAVEDTGVKAVLLPFDVSDSTIVTDVLGKWIADNQDSFIEVLVNNAGMRKDKLIIFTSDQEWHDVVAANLHSIFYVTKQVLKQMILNRKGNIINISSLSGVKGWSGQVHYSASKAGIIGASRSLAREVGKKNIRVNVITPGFIDTRMISNLEEEKFKPGIALNRFGTPEEVGDLIAFLASEKSSFITGQTISIDGGDYHPLSG
ncbi:3-oxoacyl-[acyl-carrier-protein] reductase FabG [Kordia antarctica]|uniref:3-oxoacyl-[acyl-carrier-protein] reductase FabG n=1 Tax=Kordia antarctica TaxID=1218801 RepID=A0A7L4ZK46_9FLAO|nr:SDR family NAD(P)-dependent oxidoreductase [Kordia antarctica]QHI36881.1 3-oxoacyl-[acyl-carrier-protein] reductase FabG [Kordia antarctica]